MKTTSLRQVAADRKMTLFRAAAEVMFAAGLGQRVYPVVIRRQRIPARLLDQARFVLDYRPLAGPRKALP